MTETYTKATWLSGVETAIPPQNFHYPDISHPQDLLSEVRERYASGIARMIGEFQQQNPGKTPVVRTWLDGWTMRAEISGALEDE